MPLYEYRCPDHRDVRVTTEQRADTHTHFCDFCQSLRDFKRVFSFAYKPDIEEHFNETVHKPVRSMKHFKEELKHAEERACINSGVDHKYQPLEWGDHQAFGATNEGIEESNRQRSRLGIPLLPEIK